MGKKTDERELSPDTALSLTTAGCEANMDFADAPPGARLFVEIIRRAPGVTVANVEELASKLIREYGSEAAAVDALINERVTFKAGTNH